MTITKKELEQTLNDLDRDAKEYFIAMSREDQLLVVLSMEGSNSNRLAKVEKWQIEFERDSRQYRVKREQREKMEGDHEEDVMGITQKMAKIVAQEFAKRFDFWTWFRDRVLPTIVTIITLAILYFVFGGRIPTP